MRSTSSSDGPSRVNPIQGTGSLPWWVERASRASQLRRSGAHRPWRLFSRPLAPLHRNECGAKNGGGRLLRAECRTLMDEQVAQFQDGIVEIVLAPENLARPELQLQGVWAPCLSPKHRARRAGRAANRADQKARPFRTKGNGSHSRTLHVGPEHELSRVARFACCYPPGLLTRRIMAGALSPGPLRRLRALGSLPGPPCSAKNSWTI
jgi:hypothetical protein